ncbi:SAM-dependent methyltransferase [Iamia sp.]|uniref:SAM-dependent methyltransferase n=1 Tax=Iamia sp. TaxID=2722710 RepID=UPI002B9DDF04|nr:SAM-dependent methyltransferase [Iamia sp.]HXH57082.1 SAM-dependent methyltransferase [Iamia sp.]
MGADEREPVPFSEFMDRALYAPGCGFYETGGRAGRRGDFLTSPEVGPLFGAVLARALDAWWDAAGRPDPFLVDDHGAGPGTLARTVLVARPACAPALRVTLVERSAAQRRLHPDHLPHVGLLDPDGSAAEARWSTFGAGPLVASAAAPPTRPPHLVVANELLDNLPFDLFERTADGWLEVRVATGTSPDAARAPAGAPDPAPAREAGTEATEVLVAASDADTAALEGLVPGAAPGARAPLQHAAGEWLAATLGGLGPGGALLAIDYCSTTPELAGRPVTEWLRTYSGHGRGAGPCERVGAQDITVEVCVDQLASRVRPPDRDRSQTAFLRAWGIDDLVAEGRAAWAARAGAPDLDALRARSRATEVAALCALDGLGAFRVLEWTV